MNTDQKQPMTEGQLEYVKKQIIQTYLYLISHTAYDPDVVEVMKFAALIDVHRWYDMGELS